MILTVVTFMYCPFLCEKILTFYTCFFFSRIHQDRQLLQSLITLDTIQ